MSANDDKGAGIEKYAASLRKELAALSQQKLFRAALEAGYLTALADDEETPAERATLAQSIQAISSGAVIEWEVDALIQDVAARVEQQGTAKRIEAVGAELRELGQVEVGLSVAALVALASKGLDKREASVLEKLGLAAGVAKSEVGAIVKRARAL